MDSLHELKKYSEGLKASAFRMPVYFVGHGSPMNAMEENEFTESWKQMRQGLPKPVAILCISAHWQTRGTFVTAMEQPRTIHDFSGFPEELFKVQYAAKGLPELAIEMQQLIRKTELHLDHDWGLDHGTWSILKHIYPAADVPVMQLSLNFNQPNEWHYELAKELKELRQKGVLIIGSGNIVHNLRMLNWHNPTATYDWAEEFNEQVKKSILSGEHQKLVNYTSLGKAAALAIPTPEHYLPLLYTLGLKDDKDEVTFLNDQMQMGSISMTSVKLG